MTVAPDELKRQERWLHVRNNRLCVGYEDKEGFIIRSKELSFANRAAIAYINKQRILGSSWPTLNQCVEKHK